MSISVCFSFSFHYGTDVRTRNTTRNTSVIIFTCIVMDLNSWKKRFDWQHWRLVRYRHFEPPSVFLNTPTSTPTNFFLKAVFTDRHNATRLEGRRTNASFHSWRLEWTRIITCHIDVTKAVFCFSAHSRDWWSNRVHYEAYSSGRQYIQHACSCKRSFNLYRYNAVIWWRDD